MATKINKALDLNKLFQEHGKGKLLKKKIEFPVYSPIKYDGNYVVVLVDRGQATFHTSGGLTYRHLDNAGDIFKGKPDNAYYAERIHGEGKLGDRNRCNLKGAKTDQTSEGHSYKVFGVTSLENYYDGRSGVRYELIVEVLEQLFEPKDLAGRGKLIVDQRELDAHLDTVVGLGFEGVMGISPSWKWSHHKTSRRVNFLKYKKRPTVDLLCIDVIEGEGKYVGMIGSLRLRDKAGRVVDVGSGMSDLDRMAHPSDFKRQVVEMFYEQIVDTYIQPTFGSEYEGVLIRHDKTAEEID